MSKLPTLKPKSSSRVLTSIENLQALAMKEKKKIEEAQRKEERKRARELKRQKGTYKVPALIFVTLGGKTQCSLPSRSFAIQTYRL